MLLQVALFHSFVAEGTSQVVLVVKNPPANEGDVRDFVIVWSLGWEDSLKEGMATHFSILVWEIPWTEEPGRPQTMGSQRVRHNWVTEHT